MTKSKKNLAIVVALITLLVALGSIFAIFAKPTTVEATDTRAPGLYNGSEFTSWSDLISSGKISTNNNKLSVADNLAGDLICGEITGLTSLEQAFYQCDLLVSIDVSKIVTTSVTSMNEMFYGCYSLTSVNFGSNFIINESCSTQDMFWNLRMILSEQLSNEEIEEVLLLNTSEERFDKHMKLMGLNDDAINSFKSNTSQYQKLLKSYNDNLISTIICPTIMGNKTIDLATASNHYYAESASSTKISTLSSATNNKTLSLFANGGSSTDPETGVVADISMIIIALASVVSLTVVLTKKKGMAR